MREHVVRTYVCEVCAAEHDERVEALACEASPVPPLTPPSGRLFYVSDEDNEEIEVTLYPGHTRVANAPALRGLTPVPGRHVVCVGVVAVDDTCDPLLPCEVRLDHLEVRE